MKRSTILVVEDNEDMRNAITAYLNDNGFKVISSPTGETVFEKSLYENIDLALLDISLPGISGLQVTKTLRKMGYDGPIIAVTARDTIEDKLYGLDTGMTDYIVKPFDLRELRARIDVQLRNYGSGHKLSPISTSNFRIEPKRHKFFHKNKEVKLTLVEFRIMQLLMENNQTTVNLQEIIEFAWGEEASLSNPPIRIHISNLRNKINDKSLTIIQTVPGVGYMLDD